MASEMTFDTWGNQEWRNEAGQLHRTNGPAFIGINGTQIWFQNNLPHRIGGPAIIYPNGREEWYRNGLFHRIGGPAIISDDGTQKWYLNGKRIFDMFSNKNWKRYGF